MPDHPPEPVLNGNRRHRNCFGNESRIIMSIIETLLLAASLCADCFAVSLCSSVTLKKAGWRSVLLTSLAFAVIQSALLLAGCMLGDLFYGIVEKVSNVIGFVLLAYVGGSMLAEGIRGCGEGKNLNGWKNILLGGLATSIDAAAVGVSQSMSGAGMSDSVLLLASVFLCTAISVAAGICAGKAIGNIRGRNVGRIAEAAGGAVLVGLGVAVLL